MPCLPAPLPPRRAALAPAVHPPDKTPFVFVFVLCLHLNPGRPGTRPGVGGGGEKPGPHAGSARTSGTSP